MRLIEDDAWAIMTVWQEARGESYQGKLAVCRVIRNRMKFKYASDGTVTGTVLRPYQFSGWNTKDVNRLYAAMIDTDDPSVEECAAAWDESLWLENDCGVGDAVLYFNPRAVDAAPSWAKPEKRVAVIGAHEFYAA
jgi:spore germination cell wall hydrolase CwlJ-like protein